MLMHIRRISADRSNCNVVIPEEELKRSSTLKASALLHRSLIGSVPIAIMRQDELERPFSCGRSR